MNRKVKRVKTVEETSKVVNRESISTAGKPTWNIKSVSKKSETQHKFTDRLGPSIPKDSVVRKVISTKKKKKKKKLRIEVEEKGNESSDMEVRYFFTLLCLSTHSHITIQKGNVRRNSTRGGAFTHHRSTGR